VIRQSVKRFGEEITRYSFILARARTQNRYPLLLVARRLKRE
jgi:hypothetical protein